MRSVRLGLVGALLLLLGGGLAIWPAGAATHDVSIKDLAYHPASLMVNVGDKVKWTNNEDGATAHTVHSDDTPAISSPNLVPGSTYTFDFGAPGAYSYYCTIHGKEVMSGTVIVQAPATTTTVKVTTTAKPISSATTVKPTTTSRVTTTSIDTSTTETIDFNTTTSEDTTSTTEGQVAIKTSGGGGNGAAVALLVVALAAVFGGGGYALYRLRRP